MSNNFVKKISGFAKKLFRKNKSEEASFESLDTWEKAEYAVKHAAECDEAAESKRLALEEAERKAANAKEGLLPEELASLEANDSVAPIERPKKQELTPFDVAADAVVAANAARAELEKADEEAREAAKLVLDTKAAVANRAVEWEEWRKEAAARVNKDYAEAERERKEREAFSVSAPERAEQNVAALSDNEVVPAAETQTGEAAVLYKEMSPMRMVLRRFFRSKLSLIGLIMIVVLFMFSFIGPPLAHLCGYTWGEVDADRSGKMNVAISKIEDVEVEGESLDAYQIIESHIDLNRYAPPSNEHLLGTDNYGMDVFIRLMYGGRVSLTLGFVVVILETIIGVLMGGLAGYFGGWVDQIIMRIVDILNCIPTLPILLIASVVLNSFEIPAQSNIYFLMIIITVFGWSGTARIVRGQILYLREQEFIVACEVMGIPTWRRILKHLVPNIMPQLIVSMTLGLGSTILYESTLSYLQLGIPQPYAAWGSMISTSTDQIMLVYYPNLWIPAGILIIIAVLGFNFVGDGLRDAMDPKSKR